MIYLIAGCSSPKEKAYIAIYNYSSRNDNSVGLVEVALPVPARYTHSQFNEQDPWTKADYKSGGKIVTLTDTIPLLYLPRHLQGQLFTLLNIKQEVSRYTNYLLPEEYKWLSLSQIDNLIKLRLQNIEEISYLDTLGKSHSIKNLAFEFHYFMDGKPTKEGSKDFDQAMRLDLPPPVQ